MSKNYYVTLGLNTTANPRQIKDAYRRLAKELHPDRSGLESEPFREVQEAYSVLSDPIQRRHYDRGSSIQNSRSQAEPFNQAGFVGPGRIEPLIPQSSLRHPPSTWDSVRHIDLMPLGISHFFVTVRFQIR